MKTASKLSMTLLPNSPGLKLEDIFIGAIVASSLKEDGEWWNQVSVDRVKHLMEIAENA